MANIAFIGTGHIHTPGFVKKIKDRTQDKVSLIWDHDQARAQKNADELGASLADVDAILGDNSIDGVIVCAETDRHEALVKKVAEAKKHVFVEKPLGLGSNDAKAMAEAIDQAGVLFQTGFFMRGDAKLRFIKDKIASGAFGKTTRIRMANCHSGALGDWFTPDWLWMTDVKQAGCGGFGDLGFHVIDIMLWLCGGVDEVVATIQSVIDKYDHCDETGEGMMRFSSGVMGSVTAGWVDVANPVTLQIAGTQGHAVIMNNELHFQSELIEDYKEMKVVADTDLPPALNHPLDIFLDQIAGKKEEPMVSAQEAANVCSVVEAFYQSFKEKAWTKPN